MRIHYDFWWKISQREKVRARHVYSDTDPDLVLAPSGAVSAASRNDARSLRSTGSWLTSTEGSIDCRHYRVPASARSRCCDTAEIIHSGDLGDVEEDRLARLEEYRNCGLTQVGSD